MSAPRDPISRRERRAAERAERKRPLDVRPAAWRSPLLLLGGGAVLVGLAMVAVLVLFGGGNSSPSGTGSIATPDVPPPAAVLVHGRALGDPAAPVHIDLWSDFQCPVCERFYRTTEPLLRASFVKDGTVYLTYRDFEFIGPESLDASVAARASEASGPGFWPFHDLLFSNQGAVENAGTFSRDRLAAMAVLLGMDRSAFLAQLNDASLIAAVQAETAQGHDAGVNSTPSLVIEGTLYRGLPDWTQLSALIDQLAAAPRGGPPTAAP